MSDAAEKTRELLILIDRGDITGAKALVRSGVSCHIGYKDLPMTAITDMAFDPALGMGISLILFSRMQEDTPAATHIPLFWAAYRGHADLVDFFIAEKGATQACLDLALYGAVYEGHAEIVKNLLAAGAGRKNQGEIALAVARGDIGTAHLLMGANHAFYSGLRVFIEYGHISEATALLPKIEEAPLLQKAFGDIARRSQISQISLTQKPLSAEEQQALYRLYDSVVERVIASGETPQSTLDAALMAARMSRSSPMMRYILQTTLFEKYMADDGAFDEADIKKNKKEDLLAFCLGAISPRWGEGDGDMQGPDMLLAKDLLNKGLPPERLLWFGMEICSEKAVRLALSEGADPRIARHRIKNPDTGNTTKVMVRQMIWPLVQRQKDALYKREREVFQTLFPDGRITPERFMLQDAQTGQSGLMLALRMQKDLEVRDALRGQNFPVEFFFQTDKKGVTAVDLLIEGGGVGLLLDASLWQGRKAAYQEFFRRLPESEQKHLQQENADLLDHLSAAEDIARLRQRARPGGWKL